jgi:uracil-DNA glycosylase family 4
MPRRKKSEWDRLNDRIIACDACPRLIDHCKHIAATKRRAYLDDDYWGGPIPNFGDSRARLLLVGLAPGAHGANRTGRMFTGDRSGDWLFRALHKAGFANQPEATGRDDGLKLVDCAVTNACHCAPPDNKPTRDEVGNCRGWFQSTVDALPVRVFLGLGQIGWRSVIDLARENEWYTGKLPKFSHGAEVELSEGRVLLGSFHPSQQNTFTGRLTETMFDAVFSRARRLLETGQN